MIEYFITNRTGDVSEFAGEGLLHPPSEPM
jgi:hypothetical protein